DRAGLLFEERAGDRLPKVVEPQLRQVAVGEALEVLELLEQAGGGQPLGCVPEAFLDDRSARVRQPVDQLGQHARLDRADRDELTAAGAAAGPAGDGLAARARRADAEL